MPVAAPEVIRPAFLWTPPSAAGSLGDEAAELAVQLEQDVREEERIALRALMPVKDNGMPAGLEAGIISGRQQIKSWALEFSVIHDGWVTKVRRIIWTAHQTKTSDDNFEHLCMLIEAYDWLRKRVNKPYTGNGNHKIVFVDRESTYPTLGNAGRQRPKRTIEFSARENGPTGRGRVKVNRLILDEWLFGTALMKGAFLPTMGAAGDRYVRYGSSPGRLQSENLRALRERGRIGTLDPALGDPSLSWCEWTSERVRLERDEMGRPRLVRVLPECAEPDCTHMPGRVVGCYLDDLPNVISTSNPAFGTERLPVEFVLHERLAQDPVEYARERAGIWEDPPEAADGFDNGLPGYEAATSTLAATAPFTVGIEVSADSRSAALAIHGSGVVEVVDYRKGTGVGWVPARAKELAAKHGAGIAARTSSPTEQLRKSLPEDVRWVTSTESAAACMDFARRMNEAPASLLHRDQPALAIAVANAVRAFSGDVWRWSLSKSADQRGADISPLLACVWAAQPADDQAPPNVW